MDGKKKQDFVLNPLGDPGYGSPASGKAAAAAKAAEEQLRDHHFDGLTEVTGAVGPFQYVAYAALCLTIAPHALQMVQNKWLTQASDWG